MAGAGTSGPEDWSGGEDFLFRGTPYQHMVSGTSQGVSSITVEDVKAQYAKVFGSSNLMIGIAGNYTPEFLTKLKTDMQRLPKVAQ